MDTKKFFIYIFLAVILSINLTGCFKGNPTVCFEEKCVVVELALTNQQLQDGLQYRKSLEQGHGMLFVFEKPVEVKFWMKNTLIPLDMIWMDKDKKVLFIKKNAPPCLEEICPSYGPDQAAHYVLEVNAGFASAYNVEVGDKAEFRDLVQK